MKDKRDDRTFGFDFGEPEPVAQEKCPHRTERKTETDWGEPWGKRLTWTCEACGRIRGRCP